MKFKLLLFHLFHCERGSVGAAAAGIGGVTALIGNHMQNRANAKMADRQMTFQYNMSNTAHQREAMDLEKAGLNRILSLGNGASTPPGAAPHMVSPTEGVTDAINAGSTAFSAKNKAKIDKELAENTVKQTEHTIDKTIAEVQDLKAATSLKKTQQQLTDAQKTLAEKDVPRAELINKSTDFFLKPLLDMFKSSAKVPYKLKNSKPFPSHLLKDKK